MGIYIEAVMVKGFQEAEISFMFYRLYNLARNLNCIDAYQELTDEIGCLSFIQIDTVDIFKIKA